MERENLGMHRREGFAEALSRTSDVAQKCSLFGESLSGSTFPSEASEAREYIGGFGSAKVTDNEVQRMVAEARLDVATGLILGQLGEIKGTDRRQIARTGYKLLSDAGIKLDRGYGFNPTRAKAASTMYSCIVATADNDLIVKELVAPYETAA